MLFEIKSRIDAKDLFSIETDSFRLAVAAAIKSYANLHSANLREGIKVEKAPIQIGNLHYPILIWDAHMEIG